MSKFIPPPLPPGGSAPPPRPGYRVGKSDGVLIAWTLLCVVLFIAAAGGEGGSAGGIAVFILWAILAWPLMIVYLIARAGRRRCPVCGTHLTVGPTRCDACGTDFHFVR